MSLDDRASRVVISSINNATDESDLDLSVAFLLRAIEVWLEAGAFSCSNPLIP
jgi:hypothetical protein